MKIESGGGSFSEKIENFFRGRGRDDVIIIKVFDVEVEGACVWVESWLDVHILAGTLSGVPSPVIYVGVEKRGKREFACMDIRKILCIICVR